MKAIADTGFLVAFANRNDRYHSWAVSLASGVSDPLLTCEAVLAETAFHLQSVISPWPTPRPTPPRWRRGGR